MSFISWFTANASLCWCLMKLILQNSWLEYGNVPIFGLEQRKQAKRPVIIWLVFSAQVQIWGHLHNRASCFAKWAEVMPAYLGTQVRKGDELHAQSQLMEGIGRGQVGCTWVMLFTLMQWPYPFVIMTQVVFYRLYMLYISGNLFECSYKFCKDESSVYACFLCRWSYYLKRTKRNLYLSLQSFYLNFLFTVLLYWLEHPVQYCIVKVLTQLFWRVIVDVK